MPRQPVTRAALAPATSKALATSQAGIAQSVVRKSKGRDKQVRKRFCKAVGLRNVQYKVSSIPLSFTGVHRIEYDVLFMHKFEAHISVDNAMKVVVPRSAARAALLSNKVSCRAKRMLAAPEERSSGFNRAL